jgi:hypothetical protein
VCEATDRGDARKWLCVQPDRRWVDKLVLSALRRGDDALADWALANEPAPLRRSKRADARRPFLLAALTL